MQSGSDRILKLMRRPYKNQKFIDICNNMREARPDLAITTDIIVGFPGETEEDFQQTVQCVKDLQFDNCFVFRYSPRINTPAADMGEQLSEKVKEERNQELLAVVNEIAKRKNQELVGTVQEILVEGPSKQNPDRLGGRSIGNLNIIFDRIGKDGQDRSDLIGNLAKIKITESTNLTLWGDGVS